MDLHRVHMVGIGGAGMSGLARILLSRGAVVTGSDAKSSRVVLALRSMGAVIADGHSADNLTLSGERPNVVVTSFAAIPKDNPELVAARELGIPVIRRSDLLAELMKDRIQVLLAGTHGKTSTTSMAVVAMQQAGLDPSFAIGGQLNKAGTNAHDGTGRAFVAEADESDASLLSYAPDVAVVTNIEPDHLDFFKTPEKYFEVFDSFAAVVAENGGELVACVEDEHALALARTAPGTVYGYGFAATLVENPTITPLVAVDEVTLTAYGSVATMHVHVPGGDVVPVEVTVRTPGTHMVLNAAAALGATFLASKRENGTFDATTLNQLAAGISDFTGVRRRFELKGTVERGPLAGVKVYDDYAHHPTEVAAVLRACKAKAVGEARAAGKPDDERPRVIVCFQPHLYSRTLKFAEEFGAALSLADHAIVLDIYGAREEPVEGVTGALVAEKIASTGEYVPGFNDAPAAVARVAKPGDIVLTMGAGSVTMLGAEIIRSLEELAD